jgi:transposase-like protein
MIEEKRCPKCGRKEKVKNGFMRRKQRYKCKNCGCNYTGGRNGYPEDVKQKAIKYYLEGNGFRRIERLLHVSHVSVINWECQKAIAKPKEKWYKKKEVKLNGM